MVLWEQSAGRRRDAGAPGPCRGRRSARVDVRPAGLARSATSWHGSVKAPAW